jgi:hypothetical protein
MMPRTSMVEMGTPAWIDTALIVWFVLTGLSALYVGWDAWTSQSERTVLQHAHYHA